MRTPRSPLASVLSLAACALSCSTSEPKPEVQAEIAARDSFARAAAIDAGAASALGVGSRSDVLFEDGFSLVSYDPPDDFRNHAFRWMGSRGHVRLRSHGDRPMKLEIRGWLNEKVIRSKAVVTAYLDGRRIYDTGAVESGGWGIDTVVPADVLRDARWMDLLVTVSAVGFFWSEPPQLRVVVVNSIAWSEAGPTP